MRRAHALMLLSAGLALAGCETPASPQADAGSRADQPCFNVRFLNGYDPVDQDTLRVDAGSSRYDIDLSGPECDRIEGTHRLAIETTGSAWICVGDAPGQGAITFRVPETRRAVECRIEAVRPVPAATDGQPAVCSDAVGARCDLGA